MKRRLLLGLAATLGCWALLELAIRVSGLEAFVGRQVTKHLYPVAPGDEEGLFSTRVFDPVVSWRLRPNGWLPRRIGRINAAGFVGKEFSWHKRPGMTRIVALGDSVTYGVWQCGIMSMCRDNPYPEALELLLWARTGNDAFEVINAGVYGYSSLQGLRYYRRTVSNLDADIVTIMFGWNDHGARRGREGRELRAPWLGWVFDTASSIASYRIAVALTAVATASSPPAVIGVGDKFEPRVTLDDFEYNLEQVTRAARQHGARVIFITEPCGPHSEPYRKALVPRFWLMNGLQTYERMAALHAQYSDRMRAVAARLQVPLVDAAAEFERRGSSELFSPFDMVHPNQRGYAVIAELLYERMRQLRWLREPKALAEG